MFLVKERIQKMVEWLKKVYHKYSNSYLVRMVGDIYRNGFFISNYLAYLRLKRIVTKKEKGNVCS